ncbi:hypothetical protein NFJ02_02g72130 [Pycnococcus provasolii]
MAVRAARRGTRREACAARSDAHARHVELVRSDPKHQRGVPASAWDSKGVDPKQQTTRIAGISGREAQRQQAQADTIQRLRALRRAAAVVTRSAANVPTSANGDEEQQTAEATEGERDVMQAVESEMAGEGSASGGRLQPLTGVEPAVDVVRWLAHFQQMYQGKVYNATYHTVTAFIVANTSVATPAWELWQDILHNPKWQTLAKKACR